MIALASVLGFQDRQFQLLTRLSLPLLARSIAQDGELLPTETSTDRQARLRGSITPERDWWDLQHYHLSVEFIPETKRIKGTNKITFKTLKPRQRMQIDLQPPLNIDEVKYNDTLLKFEREGNVSVAGYITPRTG